jgi:Cdc6-like AAA superfamily ATPase
MQHGFNGSEAPILPKDTIKLIADSALQAGITLFGGYVGGGKTFTTKEIVDRIKKNNNFNANHVFYINTYEELEAGRSIRSVVDNLKARHEDEHLLVVFDEVHHEKTLALAIKLAEEGHSVFGVAQVAPNDPLVPSSVLKGTVSRLDESLKLSMLASLLQNVNMIAVQNTLTTHMTCSLTYRDKHDFADMLGDKGLELVSVEIDARATQHQL